MHPNHLSKELHVSKRQAERFWAMVDMRGPDDCWLWIGNRTQQGYGRWYVTPDGKNKKESYQAHRAAYILTYGQIPRDKSCDHLCRNRACVNPRHIEVVTSKVNALRSRGTGALNAAKTHCDRGHELTRDNLSPAGLKKGWRECMKCKRARRSKTRPPAATEIQKG